MSEVKMSDVFGAMVNEDNYAQRLSNGLVLTGPEKDAAAHAIHNHDRLVAENKALKEALDSVLGSLGNEFSLPGHAVDEIESLLEKLK